MGGLVTTGEHDSLVWAKWQRFSHARIPQAVCWMRMPEDFRGPNFRSCSCWMRFMSKAFWPESRKQFLDDNIKSIRLRRRRRRRGRSCFCCGCCCCGWFSVQESGKDLRDDRLAQAFNLFSRELECKMLHDIHTLLHDIVSIDVNGVAVAVSRQMPFVLLVSSQGMEEDRDASCKHAIEDTLASGTVAWRLQAEDGAERKLCNRLWCSHACLMCAADQCAFLWGFASI